MNPLRPEPPFVWPEPRVIEGQCNYLHHPPFAELVQTSRGLFGVVSAITTRGVETLERWLQQSPELQARIVVVVYPTCATKEADLSLLLQLVERIPGRVFVHIHPLEVATDRATNMLCFLAQTTGAVNVVAGPTDDFGAAAQQAGQVNLVFRADPGLVDSIKEYFDWLWLHSCEITANGAIRIPNLMWPPGTADAARAWWEYVNYGLDSSLGTEPPTAAGLVDPVTGDATAESEEKSKITSPTDELGVPKMDELGADIARIYGKGALVSIDKLSRIPPLDAPLNPSIFGDSAAIQTGNVKRKVSMRVTVIDDKTRKEIEKRRQGMHLLLTKFTFGLADNMRWMPYQARPLFEAELDRVNAEGHQLISNLLKGNPAAFVQERRPAIVADLETMYAALGKPGFVPSYAVDEVVESLVDRLKKAHLANFMPQITYSVVTFDPTVNELASPWGQAFALLADIVAFPRKALTDSFFFRGLRVSEDDLFEAMNVVDDALFRDLHLRGIKDRCRAELDLIAQIKQALLESRVRCELVWRILAGDTVASVSAALYKKLGQG
jgi:hypothetical protein